MEPAAEGYEPLSSRAAWAQRALIVVVALDAVASISAYFAYRVYQQDVVTQDDLDRTDLREGVVAVLWGVALVFAAVFFIRWFRRAYLNLPPLGVTRLRFATWWSIGGWFIPIWSFFRPKQIANDLWRANEPDGPANRNLESVTGGVPRLFFWWWACFLASSWLGSRSGLADFSANDLTRAARPQCSAWRPIHSASALESSPSSSSGGRPCVSKCAPPGLPPRQARRRLLRAHPVASPAGMLGR